MKRKFVLYALSLLCIWIFLDIMRPFLPSALATIIPAFIPTAVPPAFFQGTATSTTKFQGASGSTTNGHCPDYDGTGLLVDSGSVCGGSGAGTPGSTLFSSTTSAGPNNSAAETSLIGSVAGSTTIAANTFVSGSLLHTSVQGFFSLPAVSDSLTFKLKCGSTVLASASFTPGAGALTNGTFRVWLDVNARGSGAGGSLITNGLMELSGSALTPTDAKLLNTSAVAYDFTTTCVMDMTAQWGGAQVGELMTGTGASAWFPGAPVTSVFTSAQTGAAIPTTHDLSLPPQCVSSSASSTAYTCSTSKSFTPASGDTIYWRCDVANAASATLNVNSTAAKALFKFGDTTAVGGGECQANQWTILTLNNAATQWDIQGQIGVSYPPASGSWTAVVNTGSYNSTYGPLYVQPMANSWTMLAIAQPSTPYTIDVQYGAVLGASSGNSVVGIGFRESSSSKTTLTELESNGGSATQFGCINRTSNTVFDSFGCGTSAVLITDLTGSLYLRIQNTGTVLRWFTSPDGRNWQQFGSDVNINTFFTTVPNQVLVGCLSGSAGNLVNSCSLISYYSH